MLGFTAAADRLNAAASTDRYTSRSRCAGRSTLHTDHMPRLTAIVARTASGNPPQAPIKLFVSDPMTSSGEGVAAWGKWQERRSAKARRRLDEGQRVDGWPPEWN